LTIGRYQRPLRLAYLLPKLQIGGAELQTLALAERLPRDRFEVDVVSLIGEGPLDQRGRAGGVRIQHIGTKPLSTTPLPVRALGRVAKLGRYAALARGSRYDIVDAWLYPSDVFAALGRYVTGTPIVVSGRVDLLPRDDFGPISSRVDVLVNRLVDAVVANSEIVASAHRGRNGVDPAKLHVIRNGIELTEPVAPSERNRIRHELGAGDNVVLVGAVGSLREVKRHDALIDAFSDVVRTHRDLRLAIIGEGPMRRDLERQIDRLGLGSHVRLPGAVVDVRPLFDAFDMVAMSSQSEGLPNALIEGAAAGKPIVTTAAGGAVEVVIDEVTGLVVPVGDRGALASALARMASDSELRERWGAAARTHAAANFGMERFVREWCALYEGLAVAKGLIHG
jgi:glycosyltransferase involved in cell wall biosynthesis